MNQIHNILLILHIVAGSFGLVTGTINLIFRKSGARHRVMGIIFTIAMLLTGFSAIGLAWINPSPFLFIVGVFTVYMVGTGYRYIRIRNSGGKKGPQIIDWILTVGMAVVGIVFLVMGGYLGFNGDAFGVVYIVFGLISLLFVSADRTNYGGKSKIVNYWQVAHLQRMIGAYIASVTAFLVVNSNGLTAFIPGWLFWLLPSIILTPLIIIWSRKYGVVKGK